MKYCLIILLALSPSLFAQTATYNPTALTDYSPCSTLYLSTYNTCLYDSTPFSSGSGTNTAPSGYNTDSIAAMNRVVPLDSTGAVCSGPPYAAGCYIGVLTLGMSIAGRDSCYGLASGHGAGSTATPCVAESFICQAVGAISGFYPGGCTGTGNANVSQGTDTGGARILHIINAGDESQQLEQWQNDTAGNYTRANYNITHSGLTAAQIEVIIWMGVDTSPENNHAYVIPAICCDLLHLTNGGLACDSRDYSGTNVSYPANGGGTYPSTSPKSSTQIDECMYMANLGLVSRYVKTFAYPNTQQIFWNTINYTGWNTVGGAQPEPFAYETGFGIRNSIQAQIKQRAGSYSSPTWNRMTLDSNYDCAGNPGTGGNGGGANCTNGNTSCTCTGGACAAANVGHRWPCAPIWEWGNYEWGPACVGANSSPGGTRTDGFCWVLADFTATDYVHPKSTGTGSRTGIMKVSNGMLVAGNLVGGTVQYYLNSPYAAWFQNVAPPIPPSPGVQGMNGATTLNGGATIR